jgi:biopolymer transport protein ExbB
MITKRFATFRTLIAALLITFVATISAPVFAEEVAPAAQVAGAQTAPTSVAAPASATTKETVDNPYGLDALWKTGDLIAKSTLVILGIMSIGTWYIFFTKFYEQLKLGKQAKAANATFWSAGNVQQAVETLEVGSPFHFISKSAVEATASHVGLLAHIGLNAWITQSIQRSIDNIQSRLQDGLAFLATVGATSPFIGLFGTVWGIYHALTAIGIAGQASIDKVAGPVGEALIMTAIGLFVAVPAVLGYNLLVRRNKAALETVRSFGADLHAVLLGEAVSVQVDQDQTSAEVVKLSPNAPVKIVSAAFAN